MKRLIVVLGLFLLVFTAFQAFSGPETVAVHDDIDKLYDLKTVNGSVYYVTEDRYSYYPVYRGETYGKKYERVKDWTPVNGSLAYVASDGSSSFVVYEGKTISDRYSNVRNLDTVSGRISYTAGRVNETFAVVGDKRYGPFGDVLETEAVNGSLAVLVQEAGRPGEKYIFLDGRKYAMAYDPEDIFVLDGEIGYVYSGEDYRDHVVLGNRSIGSYDFLYDLQVKGGKLALEVSENGTESVIVDGQRLDRCDLLMEVAVIDGKPACRVSDYSSGESFIRFGNEKIGEKFPWVSRPHNVNGTLVYAAFRNGTSYIFRDGDRVLSTEGHIMDLEYTERGFVYSVLNPVGGLNLFRDGERVDTNSTSIIYGSERDGKMIYRRLVSHEDLYREGKRIDSASLIEEPVWNGSGLFYVKWENGVQRIHGDVPGSFETVASYNSTGREMAYILWDGDSFHLLYDNREGRKFEDVGNLKIIDGKPVFRAEGEDGRAYLSIGHDVKGPFNSTSSPVERRGKPFYTVNRSGETLHYLGNETVEQAPSGENRSFRVRDTVYAKQVVLGNETSPVYDHLETVDVVNGKLAVAGYNYSTESGGDGFYVYYGGEEYGSYSDFAGFTPRDGKLVFAVKDGGAWKILEAE